MFLNTVVQNSVLRVVHKCIKCAKMFQNIRWGIWIFNNGKEKFIIAATLERISTNDIDGAILIGEEHP